MLEAEQVQPYPASLVQGYFYFPCQALPPHSPNEEGVAGSERRALCLLLIQQNRPLLVIQRYYRAVIHISLIPRNHLHDKVTPRAARPATPRLAPNPGSAANLSGGGGEGVRFDNTPGADINVLRKFAH